METSKTERQQQQSKRKKMRWPKWLRGRFLIRWLFILGPFAFRIWRLFQAFKSMFDG